ncbi:MAG: hypothetical protein EA397_05420 [Deltaproteobacteria bacterium]|nr:MAG: hypothetical protein EA397_05420 [Deltaproteobacteria bacterium]
MIELSPLICVALFLGAMGLVYWLNHKVNTKRAYLNIATAAALDLDPVSLGPLTRPEWFRGQYKSREVYVLRCMIRGGFKGMQLFDRSVIRVQTRLSIKLDGVLELSVPDPATGEREVIFRRGWTSESLLDELKRDPFKGKFIVNPPLTIDLSRGVPPELVEPEEAVLCLMIPGKDDRVEVVMAALDELMRVARAIEAHASDPLETDRPTG